MKRITSSHQSFFLQNLKSVSMQPSGYKRTFFYAVSNKTSNNLLENKVTFWFVLFIRRNLFK